MDPIIEIDNASVAKDGQSILENVDITVQESDGFYWITYK